MKFRVISDIHTEILPLIFNLGIDRGFVYTVLPNRKDDKKTNLILAGDIGSYKTLNEALLPFLRICSKRFKQIFYIPGNHEYYHGTWQRDHEYIAKAISSEKALSNVVFGSKIIHTFEEDPDNKIVLIAAILWSDIDEGGPLARLKIRNSINDYRVISEVDETGEVRKLLPSTTIQQFHEDKAFLGRSLALFSNDGYKIVVVTHHGPSYQSATAFRGSPLNCAFTSSLEDLILDYSPAYWIHGHTHNSYSYEIDKTKVICNPYGYPLHEVNKAFNPSLSIEV